MLTFIVFYESITDGPTDGRTNRPTYRDKRTHLKIGLLLQQSIVVEICDVALLYHAVLVADSEETRPYTRH